MNKLDLDKLKIRLLGHSATDLDALRFLEYWKQVMAITDDIGQKKVEIPDQYEELEKKGTKISEYAQKVRQTADNRGFRVLDAQVSKYSQEQKKEFLPPKIIVCINGTLDDIAQKGIETASELVKQRVYYDAVLPDVDIEAIDDYFNIGIHYKKNRGTMSKLLTKPNEIWLRSFKEYLEEIFDIKLDLNTYLFDELSDYNIAKRRKRIHDELRNTEKEPFLELVYSQLAGNTANHARFMEFKLEQKMEKPNIYVADLRQFLFARSELKDSRYFGSYLALAPK